MPTPPVFNVLPPPKLKQQIWFRQTVYTLSLALFLGLTLSAVTIVLDLLDEQAAARANAHSVAKAMQYQAAQAVFNIDPSLAETVTKGLSEYEQFRKVEIIDDLKDVLSSHTHPPATGSLSKIANVLFETDKPVTVQLYYPGLQEDIGCIKVYLNSYHVARDFLNRSFRTIIASLIRNIVLSGCLLALFYYTLTKPLVSVARQISEIDPANPQGKLQTNQLHASTELGHMTALLNNLLDRLHWVQHRQQQAEEKLLQHKIYLEDMVTQRTEELIKVNQQLAEQASQDPLTGIMNRRAFFDAAVPLLEQAKERQYPISLMMLDLDQFKSINDAHGHGWGDKVLKSFVTCVSKSIRGTDIFARIGGEEFVLILNAVDSQHAEALGQRICKSFSNQPHQIDGQVHYFTVSIGLVSCIPDLNTDLSTITRAADKALYLAKENGRNRLEVHTF